MIVFRMFILEFMVDDFVVSDSRIHKNVSVFKCTTVLFSVHSVHILCD